MIFNVLTLFPDMFKGILENSILKRAIEKNLITINLINIRDYTKDKHKNVDDYPYGGGCGMIMMVQPIYDAVKSIKNDKSIPVYYMGPKGNVYNQEIAIEMSKLREIILLCGHYEGIDERAYSIIDKEISIGDFVMTGGEIAAMAIIDSVSRLIPGVLPQDESFIEESFYKGLLEYPQYTRPREFMGMEVPEILLSGNHAEIAKWRRQKSIDITFHKRPDLLKKENLTDDDIEYINEKGYSFHKD